MSLVTLRTKGRSTLLGMPLTHREIEVLSACACGLCNKGAAKRLDLSPSTIADYLKTIFAKLGVNCRTTAVLKAERLGLLKEVVV